ncbi:MAG: MMPL family transporter [Verrucomicrobia bacterium]|nr:MMPL family transporter [Verrucomicrobiota bacterium]
MSTSRAKPSPAIRVLTRLADAVYNHRRWFFYPQAALFLVCLLYTVRHLEFVTERNALVGGDKLYHRVYLDFKREFPVQDDLVVVVESDSLERKRQFVERLGAKIERETDTFAGVLFKFDFKNMGPKALLFLPETNLADLRATFAEYAPMLRQFTQATNLVSMVNLINTQFRTGRDNETAAAALTKGLPALLRIVTQAGDALRRLGRPPSPGINALFEGSQEAERQMYLSEGDGRIFLLTATAHTERGNPRAVDRLRELIAETQVEVPGLNVGLTGEPVLEVDEMAQSQKDTTLASVISLVLVALIFTYGYHETGRPLKATACLLVGIAFTMGYTTLSVGHLNILTITFVPILVGLAIDFGVHLVTRYEEELWHGRTEREALEKAMVYTGLGIFTGALTTAAAFFAMAGTDFKGIQEMGVICGGGLLVSLAPMIFLLSGWLLTGRQNLMDHRLAPTLERRAARESNRRERIERLWLDRPVTTVALIAGLSLLCIGPARRVRFDYNLLHLQSAGMPAVVFQDKLIQSASRPLLSAALVATNLDQATNLMARVSRLPTVATAESMAPLLAEDQTRKLALIRDLKEVLATIRFQPLDPSAVDVEALKGPLYSLHGYIGAALPELEKEAGPWRQRQAALRDALRQAPAGDDDAAQAAARELAELEQNLRIAPQLEALRAAITVLQAQILTGDPQAVSEKLTGYQQALFSDVQRTFAAFQQQDASGPMRIADLPPLLRQRFVGVTGKHLIMVFPRKDVWDRAAQEAFVTDLRTVDPLVTGTPVQLLEYTTLLKTSFEEAALYSLAAIGLMVFVHFRRLLCVLLALLPVALGMLWMVGVMGWAGIDFNPANIMTLPLVIGVGVTNGIHILNRFAEEQHPAILARSTGKAVLVSGLTTIAGFGSLMTANHQGIASLGCIMATGTATCMVVALTLMPAILNLLRRGGWTLKSPARHAPPHAPLDVGPAAP